MLRRRGRGPASRIETIHDLESAREHWQALSAASGNPFGTWELASAWWRARRSPGALQLVLVRSPGGRVAGILPLYRSRRGPVTVLRFLAHDLADQLGPVCAREDLPLMTRALTSVASELPPTGVLLAERLAGEDGVPALVGARAARRESSPTLRTEGRSWEQWLQERSSNLRQQIRRRERKLVRDHALRLRLTADASALEADFTTLVSLHRQRWHGGGSAAFTPERELVHREFARTALERGWLRLWIAEADGDPVAAWYGLRFAQREWYYQAGRDPRWDDRAVGFVLLVHTIRAAFEDGMREYRFGLGDEPYKARFATSDPGLDSLVLGRGRVGAAVTTAALAAQRLPPRARRALVRGAA